jgi:hypothetical protein
MMYVALLFHIILIGLARRFWRKRGWEWSAFDTAECVIMPFVLLIVWMFAANVIPEPWLPSDKAMADRVGLAILFLPPLIIFWSWFYWSGLKGKRRA